MRRPRLRTVAGALAVATALLAAPSAVVAAHAADDDGPSARIIGGETVASASWAAGLYDRAGNFGCSGTLT